MAKFNKNEVPEGFTFMMALEDFLPVLFFSFSVGILSGRFHSMLFAIGAFLVVWSGILKCLWKFAVALAKKNIPFLFYQMRVVMPVGFLIMIVGLIIDRDQLSVSVILSQMLSFPACIFYLIGIVLMILMSVFAVKLDSNNAKNNWIEQGTNAVAQLMFLIGILL